MQVITRSSILALLVCTLTFVRGQDGCTRDDFVKSDLFNDHVDTTTLDVSYPHDTTVRLQCKLGYVGLYRITCSNGTWTGRGRKCEAKTCGHPGASPFADFRLAEGEDYVFGSKVVYTCRTGHIMVSRTDHRNCLDQGWDNAIPVCEERKCPSLNMPADDNMNVYGNVEEASYGNVIQFDCRNDMVLKGPSEISCTDQGEWTSNAPTCIEVICDDPGDRLVADPRRWSQGRLGTTQTYICERGNKAMAQHAHATCTKTGWIPNPLCEEITCSLPEIPNAEIENLGAQQSSPYKYGDKLTYHCKTGYEPKDRITATCTENGWENINTCSAGCPPVPRVENAESTVMKYKPGTRTAVEVSYQCPFLYKLSDERNVQCTSGRWGPVPVCYEPCTVTKADMELRNIRLAYAVNEKMHAAHGDHITFSCVYGTYFIDERQRRQMCRNGEMYLPQCQ